MKKITPIILSSFILFTSGCTSYTTELEKQNMRQKRIIEKNRIALELLNQKFREQAIQNKKNKKYINTESVHIRKNGRTIKLKKIEDTNYSSEYMYPKTHKKKIKKIKVTRSSSIMTKEECIAIVGEDKFIKYTNIFGSEEASIKRCKMIKALNN